MFTTNEYFDGKVKSIAFATANGPATMGVMATREYEVGPSTVEHMTVISGNMVVQFDDQVDGRAYKPSDMVFVPND